MRAALSKKKNDAANAVILWLKVIFLVLFEIYSRKIIVFVTKIQATERHVGTAYVTGV